MTVRIFSLGLVCFLLTITTACTTRMAHQTNGALSPAAPGTSTNILSPDSKEALLTPVGPTASAAGTMNNNQERIQNFQVNGKIAVQTAKNSGSATVSWTQRQQHFYMTLVGPLGSHRLVLQGVPGHVLLQTADGKRAEAGSPEELLAKGWGFRLPVSNLKYWIRGVPAPGIPQQTQYDQSHHLIRLVQQHWHIDYLGYTRKGSVDLPQKMSITSPTLRAKIMIYQWTI